MKNLLARTLSSPQSVFWLIIGALILVMVVKYNGMDMRYRSLLLFYQNPDVLLNDWFFTDSIYLKGSYFYALMALAGIPIEDNLVAVLLYALLSGAVLYSSYRLVWEHFDLEDRQTALLVVLLGCFLFFKFMIAIRASILGSVAAPNNPTVVAHIISYVSLYFLVSRRIVTASLLITLALSIASKGNFILLPIAGLYILINPHIKIRNFGFLVIPLAYVLMAAVRGYVGDLSYEDLIKLSEAALWREEQEAALNLQLTWALILFSSTFLVMPFLIRQFESQSLRSFAWSVYVVSLAVFVAGYFYTLVGYKIYPNPMLILIAPTRAMKFYTLIFCLMFFSWALKTKTLVWYEKIAAVFSLFILKSSLIGIAMAAGIAVIGIAIPKALRRFGGVEITDTPILRKITPIFKNMPLPALITLLIIMFLFIRMETSYPGLTNFDPIAYRHSNIWSGKVFADDETWEAYKALKETPDKEPMLAYYEPYNKRGTFRKNNSFNLVSEKPHFLADPSHHYLSPKKWDEAYLREQVVYELTRFLNKGKSIQGVVIGEIPERKQGTLQTIDNTFEEFLRQRNASVFVPSKIEDLFPSYLPRKYVKGFILIKFPKPAKE